jgi:hypothetical protein
MLRKYSPSDREILDKMTELDDEKENMTDAEYLMYANGLLETYRFWKNERNFTRVWQHKTEGKKVIIFYHNHKGEAYCFKIRMQ